MRAIIPLEGKRFGMIRVISRGWDEKGHIFWNCECDCGKKTRVQGDNLKSGNTRSCGCQFRINSALASITHHMTGSKVYRAWSSMKMRCTNPNNKRYSSYGARGITFDPAWEVFENFYRDMGDPPSSNSSIERKDVNANYCKENCCWIPRRLQALNTRSNRRITYRGETKCLTEWCRVLGLSHSMLNHRLRAGESFESAISRPRRITNRRTNVAALS
jgi:hypothetical protein